jgi:vacuolar-type H+-ATPase subunit I/STV1
VNCESNYILNADGLTDEQLAKLKGDAGLDGRDGVDGKDADMSRVEANEDAITALEGLDRTDVLVDDNGSYGATIRDEHGNTIEVLDREVTDQLIVQDINQHEALYGNDNKEGVVNTANRLDEQLNGEGGLVDQVADIDQSSKDRDDALQSQINTQVQETKRVEEESIGRDNLIVENQAKVDSAQDVRMTKAEQELYSTTARSVSNEKRIDALEGRMDNVEIEIAGMKKGIAAMAAVSGLVEPKYAGDTTISVGVGYAHNETAIAIGATHNFTQNFAGKVAVGADTSFDEVVATGSVGFSF